MSSKLMNETCTIILYKNFTNLLLLMTWKMLIMTNILHLKFWNQILNNKKIFSFLNSKNWSRNIKSKVHLRVCNKQWEIITKEQYLELKWVKMKRIFSTLSYPRTSIWINQKAINNYQYKMGWLAHRVAQVNPIIKIKKT